VAAVALGMTDGRGEEKRKKFGMACAVRCGAVRLRSGEQKKKKRVIAASLRIASGTRQGKNFALPAAAARKVFFFG
jgi:ribosomal protein S26